MKLEKEMLKCGNVIGYIRCAVRKMMIEENSFKHNLVICMNKTKMKKYFGDTFIGIFGIDGIPVEVIKRKHGIYVIDKTKMFKIK